MPVNYDRAVTRAVVFDRARNRDFGIRWYVTARSLRIAIEAPRYRLSNGKLSRQCGATNKSVFFFFKDVSRKYILTHNL